MKGLFRGRVDKNINILVVEDDYFSNILIQEYLKTLNAEIKRVKNGKEAVEYCKNNNPDIILMDILMPGMCGIEAIKIIKQEKPFLRFIAQTAYATKEKLNEIIKAGFDAVILKPYKKEDLLNLVKREINKTKIIM